MYYTEMLKKECWACWLIDPHARAIRAKDVLRFLEKQFYEHFIAKLPRLMEMSAAAFGLFTLLLMVQRWFPVPDLRAGSPVRIAKPN